MYVPLSSVHQQERKKKPKTNKPEIDEEKGRNLVEME